MEHGAQLLLNTLFTFEKELCLCLLCPTFFHLFFESVVSSSVLYQTCCLPFLCVHVFFILPLFLFGWFFVGNKENSQTPFVCQLLFTENFIKVTFVCLN